MSELVKNANLKCDWEKRGYYTNKGIFFFAIQEYESTTEKGTIPLVFTPTSVFVWNDDHVWSMSDIMEFAASEGKLTGGFPEQWDIYTPILNDDLDDVDTDLTDYWGLTEYRDDIMTRFKDLDFYNNTKDMDM